VNDPYPCLLPDRTDADSASGWSLVLAAAATAEQAAASGRAARFADDEAGRLRELEAADTGAVLAWEPGRGWRNLLPAQDGRYAVVDLYLPYCSAHAGRPLTVGHIGQSLDGFVATPSGDSYYVTGPANILHLHRMRALCDAVIVGAGTVVADDPRLTTRLASGPNPLRVILDPSRRLDGSQAVFRDGAAPTLRACLAPGAAGTGGVSDLTVAGSAGRLDLADLLRQLRLRGCVRIFVEGGGITVSAFLQAGLLDRLQVAIAALLIGDGRPALRLPPSVKLAHCLRPPARVFRMGRDVFYDCDLAAPATRQDVAVATDDALSRLF
jgi:diaminohydroxyphosphoribosylaminopyrimidine deaminase/5-amino-6-(5-phosphoribosylamino)uracil reductase